MAKQELTLLTQMVGRCRPTILFAHQYTNRRLFSSPSSVSCPSLPNAALSRSRAPSTNSTSCRKNLHTKPELANEDVYKHEGIKGLYSQKGYKVAWSDYQKYLLSELNKRTQATEHASKSVFDIMLSTARHADQVPLFNFSSLAHNNHFFFHALRGETDEGVLREPLTATAKAINESFSNLEELKDHMAAVAEGMCGNGFVWLIEGPKKTLYVVATYNAGTPYDFARRQNTDLNSPTSFNRIENVLQKRDRIRQVPQVGPSWPLPLLCINTWEHAYIYDYGVGGKAQYFENWWKSIDWMVVEERLSPAAAREHMNEKRDLL